MLKLGNNVATDGWRWNRTISQVHLTHSETASKVLADQGPGKVTMEKATQKHDSSKEPFLAASGRSLTSSQCIASPGVAGNALFTRR